MEIPLLPSQSTAELFTTLLQVMDELRGPTGCPWDKQQTHSSLVSCLLEETHEVIEAIDAQNSQHLKEELGDVLLQVVFHSRIGKENGTFEIRDVLIHLINKLVRRHPHVFAAGKVEKAEDALRQWEQIKAAEKSPDESLLAGVPARLPSLARAARLGAKASRAGFDWPDIQGVLAKVEEEIQELHFELGSQNPERIEEEFGDLLFSLAQAARFLKVNPEEALRKSAWKFQHRFEKLESLLRESGTKFSEQSPEALHRLWESVKSFTTSVKKL